MEKKKIEEYDVLRVVLTLLVLFGHCSYYVIETKYGGINYEKQMLSNGISASLCYRLFSFMVAYIYTFHMPLFIALSGALFEKEKIRSICEFAKYKAGKLLIPFIAVSLFYAIPLKYISGYWASSNKIIYDIIVGQIFIQGNTYLWFLPVLFLEMLFFNTLRNKKLIDNKILAVILLFMNILSNRINIVVIKLFLQYALWFYVGYIFEKNRDKVNLKITKKTTICSIIFGGSTYVLARIIQHILFKYNGMIFSIVGILISFFLTILGLLSTYMICYVVSKNSMIISSKWYALVRKYSFGIYLFADPLNYVILWIFINYIDIKGEIGELLLLSLRVSLTFLISIFVTYIKNKIYSFLIEKG